MTMRTGTRGLRRGSALITVLLLAVVGAALALVGTMMATTGTIIQNASDRSSALDDAALSGLEEARSRINAGLDSVPLTGFRTVENEATPSAYPGIQRSTWVARLGNPDSLSVVGEYGVQAEVVSRATDALGGVAIRRMEVFQESFARYASFSNIGRSTNGSALWWALGAQAMGPVHSNDTIRICCATPMNVFHDRVTTARVVVGIGSAEFRMGPPQQRMAPIPMPNTGDFSALRTIANRAGYVFTPAWVTGDSAVATMRLEFLAVDVNGDGDTTDPDVGKSRFTGLGGGGGRGGAGYAVARTPPPPAGTQDSLYNSPNCGVVIAGGGGSAPRVQQTLRSIPVGTQPTYEQRMQLKRAAFDDANSFCFLGGDERLTNNGRFAASDSTGDWLPRTAGSVPAAVAARDDGAYLWPLSAAMNPNFRGVIFVDGRVAVSGVVRGRVTLVAADNVIMAHELRQATNPGVTSGSCRADDDVIGVVSSGYIIYANNTLTTPQQRRTNDGSAFLWPRKDFDPSPRRPDLTVHASLLALRSNVAEGASPPPGLPVNRWVLAGTLRIIGGSVEDRLGQTGTMSGTNLHGWHDDMSFNRCALPFPPPYFPTTGRWSKSQFHEINPVGFSPASWFAGR
jgi:Tfp pilus assembly protein PilX